VEGNIPQIRAIKERWHLGLMLVNNCPLIYVFVCVCVCVCVCVLMCVLAHSWRCPRKPEEGIRSHSAGVTGNSL